MTSREGFKKLMLRTAVFNYLPPKFQGKSRFLTIFCKNCPGRYLKVMEEWRSLRPLSEVIFHWMSSSVKLSPRCPRTVPELPQSGSSNCKLGRLDKKCFVIFFVIFGGQADQPTDLGIEARSQSFKTLPFLDSVRKCRKPLF